MFLCVLSRRAVCLFVFALTCVCVCVNVSASVFSTPAAFRNAATARLPARSFVRSFPWAAIPVLIVPCLALLLLLLHLLRVVVVVVAVISTPLTASWNVFQNGWLTAVWFFFCGLCYGLLLLLLLLLWRIILGCVVCAFSPLVMTSTHALALGHTQTHTHMHTYRGSAALHPYTHAKLRCELCPLAKACAALGFGFAWFVLTAAEPNSSAVTFRCVFFAVAAFAACERAIIIVVVAVVFVFYFVFGLSLLLWLQSSCSWKLIVIDFYLIFFLVTCCPKLPA